MQLMVVFQHRTVCSAFEGQKNPGEGRDKSKEDMTVKQEMIVSPVVSFA